MPPYRSIDHIMLRLPAAEHCFDLFSRVFELPVAWPLQRTAFATYGWVHAGNTDLEFWAAASNSDLPAWAPAPLVHGFALEPALPLPQAMRQAESLGTRCKEARTFQSTDDHGKVVTNFSNSVLLDLSSASCCVFFCEWDLQAAIYPWDEAATPTQQRAGLQRALHDQGGGPLGLLGLHAVRMGTPDLQAHQQRWQALTGSPAGQPIALAPGIWLQLHAAEHLRIESLAFSVRSLATARTFLAARQLLQADSGDALWLACEGLKICLVAAPAQQA
jgi:hypothetical protein